MRLLINKAFDVIFSLGHSCQVASQLRRNQLRKAAGPLDWFNFASTEAVCKVLRGRFQGFMELEHLEVYGKSKNCYYVRDLQTSCLSFHDFNNAPDQPPLYDYAWFKEKLARRITRFVSYLSSDAEVLLIRTISNPADALRFYHAITDAYANPNLHFLFVIPSKKSSIIQRISEHERITIVQIPHGSTWEGDAAAWKSLLSSISL
ncbi:DUF1796 family putative cysteine peptidase [Paenibacillus sp. J23TS9]|uniref:DUF1796 family putative cysteine peptidase n=1 Tax=Paenibacillus sp. J23TS9 TaxID=2807193 RepID=UPI001FD5FB77|nr:DUF1796 family putative cysteine peptidase [Paenibacillus sp. J23TS9]